MNFLVENNLIFVILTSSVEKGLQNKEVVRILGFSFRTLIYQKPYHPTKTKNAKIYRLSNKVPSTTAAFPKTAKMISNKNNDLKQLYENNFIVKYLNKHLIFFY